jgi:LysR family transcriptional regulator, glycine cleavage system transcriptional activator
MEQVDWRQLPALTTLRAFEATARLQGYSAAARALNVTPAAIAQQVRKLETEVGASLVRRQGRGLVLTEAGRQLAVPLREAFALISTGIDDVRRQEAARGVRVSTTHFFADSVILPNLSDFWARNPNVQVSFSPDGNLHPVDPDNFDISIRGGDKNRTWDGYVAKSLLETPIIVCAAPDLLSSKGTDLSTLPWIKDQSMQEAEKTDLVRQAGFDPDEIRFVDLGDAKFEIEATLRGFGLSICTELVVKKHLLDGSLVLVDTPLDKMVHYYAIHQPRRMAEPVRGFLDWLTGLCVSLSSQPKPM